MIRIFSMINVCALSVVAIALQFNGCSTETPMKPQASCANSALTSLSKPPWLMEDPYSYPQSHSQTFTLSKRKNGGYTGGSVLLPNGSKLTFGDGALTPPLEIAWGDPVTITMTADHDPVNDELMYTFEPSGCHFQPSALLVLDWSDLNANTATLYFVDEHGNYTEQHPDDIDYNKKFIRFTIDHFSRYAMAISR